ALTCCFCDARFSPRKQEDTPVRAAAPSAPLRVEGNLATAPDWQAPVPQTLEPQAPDWQTEVALRFQAHRARRRRPHGESEPLLPLPELPHPELSTPEAVAPRAERTPVLRVAPSPTPIALSAAPPREDAPLRRSRPRKVERMEIDLSQPAFDFGS